MGIVNPDPSFMRELKILSDDLDCHFDNQLHRFVVTHRRAVGPPVPIHFIKTDDGGFRKPSMADVMFIADWDTHKTGKKDMYQRVANYVESYEENHHKKTTDMFRDRTKDDKLQLARRFAEIGGHGKKMQPFRKIEPKIKGKVFR